MPDAAVQSDVATLMRLGSSREAAGDLTGACEAYQVAVRQLPGDPVVRLHLGHVLERLDREQDAALAYYRAIIDAQKRGHWLNQATTEPALQEPVRQAMRIIKAGRRRAFDQAMAPVVERHGAAALRRVGDCVAIAAGERQASPDDPRQRPTMLFFPGLPPSPYADRSKFPWIADLERQTHAIRAELLEVLPRTAERERVFADDTEERTGLAGTQGAPSWDGLYFYRHGERREANHRLCPRTSAALEALPLARIREQAPEVLFSVLTPGTHILPHRGVTNTRLVCHLPLVVPEDCALVVGGETRRWREGQAVVFDDTFEHEAWNRSSSTRVVLIADVWNPDLSHAERDGVTALVEAIDDFNKASA